MVTILLFIIVLGLLVFVHELGHFLVAKRSHMQVDEFGFGFPPRLVGAYSTKHGRKFVFGPKVPADAQGTIYSINLIPLGGFVKIVGENNEAPDNPKSFGKKPFGARLLTLLAGVLMNVLLAWVLISIGLMSGVPTVVDEQSSIDPSATLSQPVITILDVRPDSPAAKAGLKVADSIRSIDGQSFADIGQVQQYVGSHKGKPIIVTIARGGATEHITVTPNENPKPNEGPTGIALGMVGKLKYPWYRALVVGVTTTATQLYQIAAGLVQLVTGNVSLNQLGGPAKIAQLTGEASKLGLVYLLQFTAFLSLNLAVLNALPIPALDGGRVLFLVIEKLRGKPNNPTIEQGVNAIGFLVLLLLMVLVTINDFNGFSALGRLFGK